MTEPLDYDPRKLLLNERRLREKEQELGRPLVENQDYYYLYDCTLQWGPPPEIPGLGTHKRPERCRHYDRVSDLKLKVPDSDPHPR